MIRVKKSLADRVFETVCWFDVFEQAISLEELHKFLLFEKADKKEVAEILRKDRRIGASFGFYFLRGKNASVVKRCGRQFQSGKLWKRVSRHLFIFRITPFLRLAAAGNTLAMGWPDRNSDIDLVVVASRNRLFTARFLLTFWTHIFRMRRHGKKIAGRFCLSFFVADSALDLAELKISVDDIYLAFWIATLVPVRGDASEFFAANIWIKKFFPNLKLPTTTRKFRRRNFCEKILSGKFGNLVERILRKWQLRRAARKRKNPAKNAVVISDEILKFHESDQREKFLREWQKRVTAKSKTRK